MYVWNVCKASNYIAIIMSDIQCLSLITTYTQFLRTYCMACIGAILPISICFMR